MYADMDMTGCRFLAYVWVKVGLNLLSYMIMTLLDVTHGALCACEHVQYMCKSVCVHLFLRIFH